MEMTLYREGKAIVRRIGEFGRKEGSSLDGRRSGGILSIIPACCVDSYYNNNLIIIVMRS